MSDDKPFVIGRAHGAPGVPRAGEFIDAVDADLRRCRRRVLRGEKLIGEFLAARDASEAGNEAKAIEQLRRYMEGV